MKYPITAAEMAESALRTAADDAAKNVAAAIKVCGELAGKDSKQSDANKAYFADEAQVRAEAVRLIERFKRTLVIADGK